MNTDPTGLPYELGGCRRFENIFVRPEGAAGARMFCACRTDDIEIAEHLQAALAVAIVFAGVTTTGDA